ncbi:MAG TPA: hypothetical protein VFP56_11030 [Candidatus Limnocylindrales bacterium]|nr:hypothetical protein [Candidatus Limnocylindrales bacterium]
MRYDIYAWSAPRDLSPEEAADRIDAWEGRGADPVDAPFEPSSDTAGFYRELEHDLRDLPGFEIIADAVPHRGRGPVWLQTEPAAPAHIAALTLPRGSESALREVLSDVYGTATKFDLVLLDAANGRLHEPMAEMGAYADRTFWPNGAIRSAIAGGGGLVAAIAAYVIGIPIVSGVVMIVGLFMFLLSVAVFVSYARRSRSGGS